MDKVKRTGIFTYGILLFLILLFIGLSFSSPYFFYCYEFNHRLTTSSRRRNHDGEYDHDHLNRRD